MYPVDQGYFPIRGNTVYCQLHFFIVTNDGHCSRLIMALELFICLFSLFDQQSFSYKWAEPVLS